MSHFMLRKREYFWMIFKLCTKKYLCIDRNESGNLQLLIWKVGENWKQWDDRLQIQYPDTKKVKHPSSSNFKGSGAVAKGTRRPSCEIANGEQSAHNRCKSELFEGIESGVLMRQIFTDFCPPWRPMVLFATKRGSLWNMLQFLCASMSFRRGFKGIEESRKNLRSGANLGPQWKTLV